MPQPFCGGLIVLVNQFFGETSSFVSDAQLGGKGDDLDGF
jgi:hypothetical protein